MTQPHTFTVVDGQGGAGVTPRITLYRDDFAAITGRTVTLQSSKVFNAGWGMKLKEMRVMGVDAGTSAVANVDVTDADATVNVYNAAGMLVRGNVNAADAVRDLPAGLYIVGNKKVLVK